MSPIATWRSTAPPTQLGASPSCSRNEPISILATTVLKQRLSPSHAPDAGQDVPRIAAARIRAVLAVNGELSDNPQTINEDPYGEGWLVRVRLSDPSEVDSLMDAAAYVATLS